MIMITFIIIYIIGCLGTSSLLLAWFHSGLPLHIFDFLKYIGLLKKAKEYPEFWENLITDWQLAITMLYPNLLSELITCPICLSFHISFWIGVVTLAFGLDLPFYYPIITAVSWPILSNLLIKLYKHYE